MKTNQADKATAKWVTGYHAGEICNRADMKLVALFTNTDERDEAIKAHNERDAMLELERAAHALMMTPGVEKFDMPHYKLAVAIKNLAALRSGKAVQS